MEDKFFISTRGDSRIAVQLSRNKHTIAFDRTMRFLIDDPETPHKLAYTLSKPLKAGLTYNQDGTFKFVLQEVTATEDDNHELGIADYYKYFPKGKQDDYIIDEKPKKKEEPRTPNERKNWV